MSSTQIRLDDIYGRSYFMEYVRLGDALPGLPGVYVAFRADWTKGLFPMPSVVYPIYVGRADDLNDRAGMNIDRHHRFWDLRRHGATHVAYLHCGGFLGAGDQAAKIERDLYDRYEPLLINEVRPGRNALAEMLDPQPRSISGGLAAAMRGWTS